MKQANECRKRFRSMIEKGIVMAPGAYDAWSASLIESSGFSAVYMTGYGVSASVLGKPDIGLVTLSEMARSATNICSAVDVPVIADADTGYGGSLNVIRTVNEYERAGVSVIQIEDQVVQKRCGHMEGKELVSCEEMVTRIKAAVSARTDPDLMIMARTDSRAGLGIDEAIRRSLKYVEAGADMIFLEAPQSIDEMEKLCREIPVPKLANMVKGGKTPQLSVKELEEIGFRLVIYPAVPLYAATKANLEVLALLLDTKDERNVNALEVDFSEFNKRIHLDELRALERSFL